jgi:hypothetical protein
VPSRHSPTRLIALVATLAPLVLAVACSSQSSPVAPSMSSAPTAPPAETPVPPSPPPPPSAPAPTTVRYRVVFDGLWTQQTHPQDFPGNPHFSPLIGGTHHGGVRFWGAGLIASDGIRRMAEQGFTSPLDAHVNDAIASGTARDLVRGGGIALSPAAVSIEFDVHQSHPLLTLVSMVAPSPDWFVGVDGVPLFANGQWVDRLVIDLPPWDAGTDGGRSYESPDAPLTPRQPIALLTVPPVAVNGVAAPMARFTITRL